VPFVHTLGLGFPIFSLIFYLIGILQILPKLISKPIDVSPFLPYWNLFLFAGSSSGAVIYLISIIRRYWSSSMYEIICDPNEKAFEGIFGFMAWLFLFSKVVEFGDTILTVLKKNPFLLYIGIIMQL